MSDLEELEGTRITRLDSPQPDVLSFGLQRRDLKETFVVHLSGALRGLYVPKERPRGATATGAITRLRHHVKGARVEWVQRAGRSHLVLGLSRSGRAARLVLSLAQGRGNAVVLAADGRVLTSLHRLPPGPFCVPDDPEGDAPWPTTLAGLRRAGDMLASSPGSALDRERAALRRSLKRRRKQLENRQRAIEHDLARGASIGKLRKRASLLIGALHGLSPQTRRVAVYDHEQDPPAEIVLDIDVDKTPATQADAWFTRARKLEHGCAIARERLGLTRAEIARVDAILARVEGASDTQTLHDTRLQALDAGARLTQGSAHKKAQSEGRRKPYREFAGALGRTIRVGRGAADNDALTLQHAAPHDLWMHARGTAGAHVIVPLTRGETCPPSLLIDAALLAAHFSKAKNDSSADIAYVERRHVRKAKGSPPGQVSVQREKVLALRPNPSRLRALLSGERKG